MSASRESNVEGRSQTSRRKVFSAEKDLYVKQLLKLKQQEDVIARGLVPAIDNMKIDASVLKDIVHEHREMSEKRQSFLKTLRKNMEDIISEMESIESIAKNREEIKRLDVNEYKLKLIKLLQKMQDFKNLYSVQTLVEEQTILDSELHEFECYLSKYKDVQKNGISLIPCQHTTRSKNDTQDSKDVEDFHVLVARTGHAGNWSTEDHSFFLKMRAKNESVPALVAAIQAKCPDLATEDIVNHEAWYKLYQNLREKQKSAVREWRRKKELEKVVSVEGVDKNSESQSEQEEDSNEIEENEKTVVSRERKMPRAEDTRSNNSADSNNRVKKELIMKWRIERENKRSMDEEQLKMQARMKREMENSRRRRRQEEIRETFVEYRRKKSLESAAEKLKEDSKEKSEYDPTLIKAFRKQDEEYTKRRNDLIRRSQQLNKSATIAIKKSEFPKVRNYSTLLNTTKVWKKKCKAKSLIKHSSEMRYIKDIPRICIRWRNEESEENIKFA